ncbi:leucine-rich repeat domain-containing protein [Chitinophagales bacterium]|nr:leucine-rich repeat domain-containing protein [Chitinophagales bacterium]
MYPITFVLTGIIDEIQDVNRMIPPVEVQITLSGLKTTVGKTEVIETNDSDHQLINYLKTVDYKLFQSKRVHFVNDLPGSNHLATYFQKDKEYFIGKYVSHTNMDSKYPILRLDEENSEVIRKVTDLIRRHAIKLLKDNVSQDTMLTAYSIEEALAHPEKIYRLHLRNSRIKSLPTEIGLLINLRVLDISGSRITKIPESISNCIYLKALIANASKLESIPITIGELKNLRILNLAACQIREVPPELGKVVSLWSLSLGSNKIDSLPNSFSNLKNLIYLGIANNEFQHFPLAITGLSSLGQLTFHTNSFESIPEEISNLKELRHFFVDGNQIKNMKTIEKLLPNVRFHTHYNK